MKSNLIKKLWTTLALSSLISVAAFSSGCGGSTTPAATTSTTNAFPITSVKCGTQTCIK